MDRVQETSCAQCNRSAVVEIDSRMLCGECFLQRIAINGASAIDSPEKRRLRRLEEELRQARDEIARLRARLDTAAEETAR